MADLSYAITHTIRLEEADGRLVTYATPPWGLEAALPASVGWRGRTFAAYHGWHQNWPSLFCPIYREAADPVAAPAATIDDPNTPRDEPEPPIELVEVVYQDGAEFYREHTGETLASYPALVRGDYDMNGARAARRRFADEFPQFVKGGQP